MIISIVTKIISQYDFCSLWLNDKLFLFIGTSPHGSNIIHTSTMGRCVQVQQANTGEHRTAFPALICCRGDDRKKSVVSDSRQWSPAPPPVSDTEEVHVLLCFLLVLRHSGWGPPLGSPCSRCCGLQRCFVPSSRLGPRPEGRGPVFLTANRVTWGLCSLCVPSVWRANAAVSPRVWTRAGAGEGQWLFGCWLPVVQMWAHCWWTHRAFTAAGI